jgi:uncharacterized protein YggE
MRTLSRLIGAISLVALTNMATAQESSDNIMNMRKIVVQGEGEAVGKPDLAEINIGVVTEAENANDAVQLNNESMTALMESLKQLQIAEKDIQTRRFDVAPQYRQDPPNQQQRQQNQLKIIGYQVTNEVHIRVRKIDQIGKVLDRIVAAGANHINGISFSIENLKPLMDDARRDAVRDARHTAEILVEQQDVKLGKVLEIRDSSAPRPYPERQMSMMSARSDVPIAAGEQTVTAHVQITFALE